MVSSHTAQVLELLVLILNASLQPVLRVKVHHHATLVEAMMTLCKVCLYNETEELFLCLLLEDWCIVVLEVIVGTLPKVGVRLGHNFYGW